MNVPGFSGLWESRELEKSRRGHQTRDSARSQDQYKDHHNQCKVTFTIEEDDRSQKAILVNA